MSALLQAPVVEYCHAQSNLRGRRFSFNPPRPQDLLSQLKLGITSQGESAVVDDTGSNDTPVVEESHLRSYSTSLPLSPLSGVHTSHNLTTISLPRYHETVVPSHGIAATTRLAVSVPKNTHTSTPSIIELETEITNPGAPTESFKRRYASALFLYFLFGWGDGVTGTVLPYFQREFGLSYQVSSLLYAGSTCGFFAGTLIVERVLDRLGLCYPSLPNRSLIPALFARKFQGKRSFSASQGRYTCLLLASIIHIMFFVTMALSTGFPTLFLAYVIAAFGRSFATATMNLYLANTSKGGIAYAYGSWSFGGTIAPIVCQTVVATGVPWRRFYLGSLCLSAINIILLFINFRPTSRELLEDRKQVNNSSDPSTPDECDKNLELPSPSTTTSLARAPANRTLRLAISLPYQWVFSFFLFLYCGSETTTQGLMATYLLAIRHANPNTVGYVTSGFWAGITLSRFTWGYYSSRVTFTQRKRLVQVSIATVMHLLIWFVNSNIENSFSTAIIGIAYGPIWPCGLATATDLLPPEVHMVSMALVGAFASVGTSLFPFITGTIATIKGAQVLTYVTVSQAVVLFCFWTLLPSRKPIRVIN